MGPDKLLFFQLFEHESSTYSYLLGDSETKEAVLIDPVLETVDRDLQLIQELGLKLKYVLDTHVHADHITGAGEIRRRTGVKTGLSKVAKVDCCDLPIEDGAKIPFGSFVLTALATPGHTDACMSYSLQSSGCAPMVFTGDALLIRGSGRTDFQQGSSDRLYDSVHQKLFSLPENTRVYPGHDYRGQTVSTIGLEKKFNPRLGGGRSKDEFKKVMSELKLAHPKKIHEALPANMSCGTQKDGRSFHPQMVNGIPEITPEDLQRILAGSTGKPSVVLVDVRRPDEFNGEYGHVKHSRLVTLGPELENWIEGGDRSAEIVFICRSGGRSGAATQMAINKGYKFVANMTGGMIRWTEQKLPAVKE